LALARGVNYNCRGVNCNRKDVLQIEACLYDRK
jgi:hypothetical protein